VNELIHLYCDESCHLEHDQARSMVLGAIWCPALHRAELARKVQAVKKSVGLPGVLRMQVNPGFHGGRTHVKLKRMW